MGTAKVARGRCLHVPTGKKVVVGSRPFEVNGAIVYRDVTADETRSALPGDVVSMPQQEIDRLMALNFLIPIDDQPRKGMKVKPARPQTGIDNDPRVKGTNSLTNGTR